MTALYLSPKENGMKNKNLKKKRALLGALLLLLINTSVVEAIGETRAAQQLWGLINRITHPKYWITILKNLKEIASRLEKLGNQFIDPSDTSTMSYFVEQARELIFLLHEKTLPLIEELRLKEGTDQTSDMYKLYDAAYNFAFILYEKIGAVVDRTQVLIDRKEAPIVKVKRKNKKSVIQPRPVKKNATLFLLGIKKEVEDLVSIETLQRLKAQIAIMRSAAGRITASLPIDISLSGLDDLYAILEKYESERMTLAEKLNLIPMIQRHLRNQQ
jgi:hypothetical protein